jgi:chromosome segregation ATPase
MLVMGEPDQRASILALAAENAELQRQLASAQDLLVEAASEAEHLQARIEVLCSELAEARATRDAWRDEAERLVGWGLRTA